jgi:hypothetical protein
MMVQVSVPDASGRKGFGDLFSFFIVELPFHQGAEGCPHPKAAAINMGSEYRRGRGFRRRENIIGAAIAP